jgi:hypothetical protein
VTLHIAASSPYGYVPAAICFSSAFCFLIKLLVLWQGYKCHPQIMDGKYRDVSPFGMLPKVVFEHGVHAGYGTLDHVNLGVGSLNSDMRHGHMVVC